MSQFLLQFLNKFGVIADIRKALLQISLYVQQREVLNLLVR